MYYLADMTLRKDVLGGQINKHIRCPKAYVLFRYYEFDIKDICYCLLYIIQSFDTSITVLIYIQKYIFFVCNQKRSWFKRF